MVQVTAGAWVWWAWMSCVAGAPVPSQQLEAAVLRRAMAPVSAASDQAFELAVQAAPAGGLDAELAEWALAADAAARRRALALWRASGHVPAPAAAWRAQLDAELPALRRLAHRQLAALALERDRARFAAAAQAADDELARAALAYFARVGAAPPVLWRRVPSLLAAGSSPGSDAVRLLRGAPAEAATALRSMLAAADAGVVEAALVAVEHAGPSLRPLAPAVLPWVEVPRHRRAALHALAALQCGEDRACRTALERAGPRDPAWFRAAASVGGGGPALEPWLREALAASGVDRSQALAALARAEPPCTALLETLLRRRPTDEEAVAWAAAVARTARGAARGARIRAARALLTGPEDAERSRQLGAFAEVLAAAVVRAAREYRDYRSGGSGFGGRGRVPDLPAWAWRLALREDSAALWNAREALPDWALAALLRAMGAHGDARWDVALTEYASDAREQVRTAAMQALGACARPPPGLVARLTAELRGASLVRGWPLVYALARLRAVAALPAVQAWAADVGAAAEQLAPAYILFGPGGIAFATLHVTPNPGFDRALGEACLDADPELATAALRAAGQLRRRALLPWLRRALRRQDGSDGDDVRAWAALAAADLVQPDDALDDVLAALLGHPRPALRRRGLALLDHGVALRPAQWALVVEVLETGAPALRREAARALQRCGAARRPDLVPALCDVLDAAPAGLEGVLAHVAER